jgi:hypothetical protein
VTIKKGIIRRKNKWVAKERRGRRMKLKRNPGKRERRVE